ncbi:MAG: hypothetical protein R3C56_09560 [Pirellulaceae bacterium]
MSTLKQIVLGARLSERGLENSHAIALGPPVGQNTEWDVEAQMVESSNSYPPVISSDTQANSTVDGARS